jgi:flagellin
LREVLDVLISLFNNQYALAATRNLKNANRAFVETLQRLTSGKRMTSLADDPSGSMLALNLESELRSVGAAERNVDSVHSMLLTAEGGLNEIANHLLRLRELTILAASDTVSDSWRQGFNLEASQLQDEIDRIANETSYGPMHLLNGSRDALDFQIGTENSPDSRITLDSNKLDVRVGTLGLQDAIDLEDSDSALDTLSAIDLAIGRVEEARSYAGGFQSRVDSIKNLVVNDYLLGSERLSRLQDTDYVSEITQNFLADARQRTTITLLAQANLDARQVLKLLEPK